MKAISDADVRDDPSVLQRALEAVLDERNAGDVERLMTLAYKYGLSRSWAQVLCDLLESDWHHSHETIALALQDIRQPSTVACLHRAAERRYAYLDYDDSAALARKCIWALHDIGTPDAIEALKSLAERSSEPRACYARKRLKQIAQRPPDSPPEPYRVARDRNVRPR